MIGFQERTEEELHRWSTPPLANIHRWSTPPLANMPLPPIPCIRNDAYRCAACYCSGQLGTNCGRVCHCKISHVTWLSEFACVCACVRMYTPDVYERVKTHAYIKMQLRVERHIIHIDICAIYVHVDNHMWDKKAARQSDWRALVQRYTIGSRRYRRANITKRGALCN